MQSSFDETFELHSPARAHPALKADLAADTHPPTLHLALYKPGCHVKWQGRAMTVSHVLLRRGRLMVCLEGHPEPVDAESLSTPLTRLVLQRS